MRFKWAGTTWTMTTNEGPIEPIVRDPVDAGDMQRSFLGTSRTHFLYRRWGFDLHWEGLVTDGTTLRYLRMIGTYTQGTVEMADGTLGTWTCMPVPGSMRETACGWKSSDFSMRLEQA